MIEKALKLLELISQQTELNIPELTSKTGYTAHEVESFIGSDLTSLAKQLDICPEIICFIFPAEDDDESEGEDENGDNQEKPSDKIQLISGL
jgi:hypothetical protein